MSTDTPAPRPAGPIAPGDVTIRPATPADRAAILQLLAASLGWVPDDAYDALFTWKHDLNPFGASAAWVALADDEVVGLRTFMRWEFEHPDGRIRRAVRAVDTATRPDQQGKGIFRRLTLHGVNALTADGVDFVYNTPNEQSRPGYLTMGWHEVGRLPAAIRPSGVFALPRIARARVPAERWSEPSRAGDAAPDVLADPRTAELLAEQPRPQALRTRRDVAHLRWRYGFGPLAYRALALDDDPRTGVAVFRIRRRGSAREAALCELLVPGARRDAARRLVTQVARACGADYVLALAGTATRRAGLVRVPRLGPVLTWRGLAATGPPPARPDWELQLGDIELM